MGFSNIWTIVDNAQVFLSPQEQASLHCDLSYDGDADSAPYLLIDINNLRGMDKSGNVMFCTAYVMKFWRAVYSSGYRIRCFRDGRHNALRGVTKLLRMSTDLSHSQESPQVTEKTFSDLGADLACLYAASQEVKSLHAMADSQSDIDVTRKRCEEEADADIRVLARQLSSEGQRVVIMSSDASLLVGVPDGVSVFCPRRCSFTSHVKPLLHGPLMPISLFTRALTRYVIKVLPREVKDEFVVLDVFSMLVIAALLGGEQDRNTIAYNGNPHNLVYFFCTFLFPYPRDLAPDSVISVPATRQLIGAAALVWLWKKKCNLNYHDVELSTRDGINALEKSIGDLVSAVTQAAYQFSRQGPPPNTTVFGLHKQNPDSIFRAAATANELSPIQIRDMILQRLCDSMDVAHGSKTGILYRAFWGTWTHTYESAAVDTELLLSPIRSLREQVKDIRGLFDVSQLPDIAVNSVTVDSLNIWLDEVHDLGCEFVPSNVQYWKSYKVLRHEKIPQNQQYDIARLYSYVCTHGVLPDSGYLGRMRFKVQPKNVFNFHHCSPSVSWVNHHHQGGALKNLVQRKEFLINLASEEIIPEEILLHAIVDNVDESKAVATDIEELWRQMLSAQKCTADVTLQDSLNIAAKGVIALLHTLIACFEGEDITNNAQGDLIDACLCSILFATIMCDKIPLTGHEACIADILAHSSCIEGALQKLRPCISKGPVGNIAAARTTELADVVMKYLSTIAGREYAYATSLWFDTRGFCAVLRSACEGTFVLTSTVFQEFLRLDPADVENFLPRYHSVKQRCSDLLSAYKRSINGMDAIAVPDMQALALE